MHSWLVAQHIAIVDVEIGTIVPEHDIARMTVPQIYSK